MGKVISRGREPSRVFPDILLPAVRAGQATDRGKRIRALYEQAKALGYPEVLRKQGDESLIAALRRLVGLRYPDLGEKTRNDYVNILALMIKEEVNNGFSTEEATR